MTKYFEEPLGSDANLTPPVDKSGMSGDRKRLFACVEKINRGWLDSMREMRRAESEFSVHLFSCRSQDSAMALCNQWLAKRREIQENEQQLFEKSWMELMTLLSQPAKSSQRRGKGGPTTKQE
ncbi:MAG: hypothetical protein WCE20_11895 [Rhizomicrobium sp.]